jgi:ABC-type transporter MlaC component
LLACVAALGQGTALAEDVTPAPAPPAEVVCVEDAALPRLATDDAFAELQRIHRNRVPGPSGQPLLEARIDTLLERFVAFDRFIDLALGDAWDRAEGPRRESWREILRETLRRRYLKKLGSPLKARIEVRHVLLQCDHAKVALEITDRQGKHRQDVELELVVATGAEEPGWRAYDVSVDGVSLLETWRSRFRRIYADGGVAAIDHHMRGLRERYLTKP